MNDRVNAAEKSAEAVQLATVHAEAIEAARAVQIETIVTKALAESSALSDDRVTKSISTALRNVFNENVDTSRFIDVSRIPLICQNIDGLHSSVSNIEDNLKWGVRIVIGAVILGLLTLLIK